MTWEYPKYRFTYFPEEALRIDKYTRAINPDFPQVVN